ncbi:helix-turn-helix domain-containing protein [Thermomonospora curvata]|uniref:Helix-turn-helix domain protein n=1 Tax=Thermomonospora curvata (strain ATCC 19995 / DSM 43183 / JCM 3096 / KCTC 9072 / NBRC 15933 / NCIMB 10081 / Henssen B9) TaxID=471852 RepID=D1ADS7_THECD|nr:helix-turn-helix transcriptional regulator [Thermomonospora curvata]ACY97537.1 helix-turn-helix domain protein [Thermomonospora curvata DSM 43183]
MTFAGPARPEPEYNRKTPASGPTVLRIVLGGQLRRLREEAGLSRAQAGDLIRGSESKISRLELGKVSFKARDVADLLDAYGVTGERRQTLLELVEQANRPGWWHQYGDVLPQWFETYLGLEQDAARIREYQLQFVPALLQTADYARAAIRLGHPSADERELQRRVELRMRRRELLTRPDPPHLWVVMDEAVLVRPVGGRAVMRAQLRHLAEICAMPTVTVQVVPFSAGGHAAAGGAFTLLRFAEPGVPDIVYLEQLTGALYIDKPAEVERYQKVMDRLCVDAEPDRRTPDIIADVLRRM